MNMQSFFKIKFIFLSLILIGITSFIPLPKLSLPILLLKVFSQSTFEPGAYCLFVVREGSIGWPFSFLHFISPDSCSSQVLLNPLGFIINLIIFLTAINLITRMRKTP